jgi:TonB-linked SusC/RagA family outer membrane protein
MKKILFTLMVTLSISVFSQKKAVTGNVTDSSGQPLPGTSIIEKGTSNGTQTDFDGNFYLEIKDESSVLQASYIGFTKKEVRVGSQSKISIVLDEDASTLDEVVVIGYGTVRKKDLTGSVSVIKSTDAYVAPVANLNNALQGRASGVQVTSVSGAPGANSSIRIRGGNSITAGNEPLYVIDGFVGTGDLSSINSNDIESIQILKDASSTAIYGARGTNGVVLITTKKGKQGKVSVNYKSSYGIQQLPSQIDVQSGSEFAAWFNRVYPGATPFDLENLPGQATNWQEELTQSAPVSDHQLSVSGGTEKTQYYISAGFYSQDGIIKGSGFDRYSLRSNINTTLSKVLKTGVNISLSRTNTENSGVTFRDLIQADPLKPVYDENGNYDDQVYGISNNSGQNLLSTAEQVSNETTTSRALINTYIQASFNDKFTAKSTFGGDFIFSKQDRLTPSTHSPSLFSGTLAQARIDQYNKVQLLNENTINYTETFGDHSINVLAGVTVQKTTREDVDINAQQIPSDGVGVNSVELGPQDQLSVNSNYEESSMFSLLGRVNYNYLEKYYLTASIRRDATSRFSKDNRVAIFPSAGLTWKMSEEEFLKDNEVIDHLKLRASFGLTGNQNVNEFITIASLSNAPSIISGGASANALEVGNIAAPNLKWETTAQYDIAAEASLFKSRLTAEVDFYYKKTTDLILDAEVPAITGKTTIIQNVGSLENKGFDVTLTGVFARTNDFDWSTSVTVSAVENKILDLGIKDFIETGNLRAPSGDTTGRLMVGQPLGVFWGAVFEGIDPATGDAIFADLSGPDGTPDGVYSPEFDHTVIGNSNADFYGGINTNLRYKKFDMNLFFPFSVGNDTYNTEVFLAPEANINSFSAIRDQMWSIDNATTATFPGAESGTVNTSNSLYVQDGSYFRLKTLQIGYTLPENLVKGISKFRLYCTATNVFLIKSDEFIGYDPDVNSNGTNNTLRGYNSVAYPQNKSLLFGLDITF